MSRFYNIVKPILVTGLFLFPFAAPAHEYWIEPHAYQIGPEDPLVADLRVGTDFKGSRQPYLPARFNAFNITDATGTRPIAGRPGDMPAANVPPLAAGLHILNLFSDSQRLSWDTFQGFDDFVNAHGMGWVLARHAERGLPDADFSEAYTRFAKSLVAVGDGAGQDRPLGMFFELVAGKNPYTQDMTGGMPVLVLFAGQPLPGKQVDVFYHDPSGELTRQSVVSDTQGRAIVPNLGPGEYLVNVVHMIEPSAEDQARTGVVWHSLWGSLTFEIGA